MDDDSLNPDAPYALNHPGERKRRQELLDLPHIAPLTQYISEIRRETSAEHLIPNFDPCDGGIDAKGLFLLDSPDRAAIESGFVSRNNLDYASRNLCILSERAGIHRRNTAIWNLTPWKLTDDEEPISDQAFLLLKKLLGLLPDLRVIVLIGHQARSTGLRVSRISRTQVLQTPYPFIGTFNMRDDAKEAVLRRLVRIAAILGNADH